MKYRIEILPSAKKELKKLPKQIASRLTLAILSLENNPRPHGCRKLEGEPSYRIRIGDYRVIYSIYDNRLIVELIRVRHRREVYGR